MIKLDTNLGTVEWDYAAAVEMIGDVIRQIYVDFYLSAT